VVITERPYGEMPQVVDGENPTADAEMH